MNNRVEMNDSKKLGWSKIHWDNLQNWNKKMLKIILQRNKNYFLSNQF